MMIRFYSTESDLLSTAPHGLLEGGLLDASIVRSIGADSVSMGDSQ